MATSLPGQPLLPRKLKPLSLRGRTHHAPSHGVVSIQAFRRSDLDGFAKRMVSGEAFRDAWRSANERFELFLFDAKKTAERIDRRYAVSRRLSVARSAADRAREIDREFEIQQRWRTFSLDFSRNWPRYRRQLNNFLDTPLGRSFATIFFLWFALSGWPFRFLIFTNGYCLLLVLSSSVQPPIILSSRGLVQPVWGSLLVSRTKLLDVQAVGTLYGGQKETSFQEVAKSPRLPNQNLKLLMWSLRRSEEICRWLIHVAH